MLEDNEQRKDVFLLNRGCFLKRGTLFWVKLFMYFIITVGGKKYNIHGFLKLYMIESS